MTTNTDSSETTLPPDDAFAVLGNETRMEILQTLGEADDPLAFSELRGRVGMRDPGQFNYHLNKLLGHFITETDDGYALRPASSRVIEAVLSGAVTTDPELGPLQVDHPCPYCGASIEVTFHQDRLQHYCPECPGSYGVTTLSGESISPEERGFLGYLHLPPAGVTSRSPDDVVTAAMTWTHLDFLKVPYGLCPRCSAPLETSVRVCTDHDTTNGICDECDRRHAVQIEGNCANCIFEGVGFFSLWLLTNIELLQFLVEHDVNPVTHEGYGPYRTDYDEEVLSVEPFEARFTFTINDDALTLTVNDNLDVVDAKRHDASEVG